MTLLETIEQDFSSHEITISDFKLELESHEYNACTFNINGAKFFYRKAKTTPKKVGQFVTFYKRLPTGLIAPFDDKDDFDFFIILAENEQASGCFIFPKNILIDRKIVSTNTKEGKRAFRIYPPSSLPKNKQALASQKWQLEYYIDKRNLNAFLTENQIFEDQKTS